MSYNLKPLDEHDIDLMVNTAVEIYNKSDPDKYPDFKITNDVASFYKFKKFFRLLYK